MQKILGKLRLQIFLCLLVALAGATQAAYRQDEVLVKYRPSARAQARSSISALGGKITQELDQIGVHRVKLPPGLSVENAIKRFRADPRVEYVGPNHVFRICLEPNDQYYLDPDLYLYWEWGLYDDQNPEPSIDAPSAWDITTGSEDIVIAIVDTGVDMSHEDLWEKIVPGRNVIAGAADPDDPSDDHGHGTFVAGVAAAMTDNFYGVAGVSWGARVMPVKVITSSGEGTEADAAAGIIWAADHGADIINMSFGGYEDPQNIEKLAVEYAWSKGCVLVAASGNDDSNAAFYPASYEQVIAVGASNESMQRCTEADWFVGGSNYGSYLDVMAPGNNIMSTAWDGLFGSYDMESGTSAAAPFVSGVAALVLSQFPTWTNAQVANQIKMTCKNIGDPGWDQYTGWGLVSAYRALTQLPMQSVSLGSLSNLANGTLIQTDAVLTTSSTDFPDRMYVEQQDRACGIKLKSSTVPSGYIEGDIVTVVGTLATVDGERTLQGANLSKVSHQNPLRPMALGNKWLGGATLGNRLGVDYGKGLNNLGLLTTVWGKVTATGWTYFYVDDGSGLSDGSGFDGIRVLCDGLTKPAKDKYVRVTGISSCEQPAGTSATIPAMRARRQSDIVPLN